MKLVAATDGWAWRACAWFLGLLVLFGGSCQGLISVIEQCCWLRLRQACVCVCVLLYLVDTQTSPSVWSSTRCLFRQLWVHSPSLSLHVRVCVCVRRVRRSVCVSWYIVNTRLIITQTAGPLQGRHAGYFKMRVCVPAL